MFVVSKKGGRQFRSAIRLRYRNSVANSVVNSVAFFGFLSLTFLQLSCIFSFLQLSCKVGGAIELASGSLMNTSQGKKSGAVLTITHPVGLRDDVLTQTPLLSLAFSQPLHLHLVFARIISTYLYDLSTGMHTSGSFCTHCIFTLPIDPFQT